MTHDEEKKVADIIKDFSAEIDRLQRENAELRPYKDELLRLADAVGEKDDPFAAWEHLEPALTRAEAAEAQVKRQAYLLEKVAPAEFSKSWLPPQDYEMIRTALSAQVQDVAEEWWVDELKSFWGDSSYHPTLETRRAVLVALNALGVTAPPASKHGDEE